MERFDEHLHFALPAAYEVCSGTNHDGSPFYRILFGGVKDSREEGLPDIAVLVAAQEALTIPEESVNLAGNFRASVQCWTQRLSHFSIQLHQLFTLAAIEHEGRCYVLVCFHSAVDPAKLPQRAALTAMHLNDTLSSVVLDGERGAFRPLSAEELLQQAKTATISPFQKELRAGLDLLGGLMRVNLPR